MDERRETVVIIDNGHGKDTPGKRSPDGMHLEWRWTRRAARVLAAALEKRKVASRILVPEDSDVSLGERCRRVRKICREREAVLVSLHNNASGNSLQWRAACGWSVFVDNGASSASQRLARILYEEAAARKLLGNRATPPCGYWQSSLAICRDVPCPAVLTENMFQDNRSDVRFIDSSEGMSAIVDLHVEAMLRYLGQ